MNTVRAQFKCTEIAQTEAGKIIKMNVDYNACKEFTPFTPSGTMQFFIDNGAPAIDSFEVGAVYNVDFNKVEKK